MKPPEILWNLAPSQFQITNHEVHIWRVPLVQSDEKIGQLGKILSPEERQRAAKFYFDRDRRGYIVSHGMLRILLGQYLSTLPDQIHFHSNSFGKPVLAPEFEAFSTCFNLTHSNELALIAFTNMHEVGIDVEYLRPIPDAERIAARTFAEHEHNAIQALPAEQRMEAFFNCWTRKEAYIKAIGEGLSRPLSDFEVSVAPGEPARLLYVRGVPDEVDRWSLHTFHPAEGYIAALAVKGRDLRCSFFASR